MSTPNPVATTDNSAPNATPPPSQDKWLDSMASFWLRFDRFSVDFSGILLVTIAVITILGLAEQTQGMLVDPWVHLLQRWFGWGSYLTSAMILLIGVLIINQPRSKPSAINLSRILALEGIIFCLMALTAIFNGRNLEGAEMGQGGGVIGWGIAELVNLLLPAALANTVLVIVLVLLFFYSLGVFQWVGKSLDRWLTAPPPKTTIIDYPPNQPSTNKIQPTAQEKPPVPDQAEEEEDLPEEKDITPAGRDKRLPPFSLLVPELSSTLNKAHIRETALLIEKTLSEFGVPARVVGYRVGPTITQFAVEPGFTEKNGVDGNVVQQKVRISQISSLSKDLARALSAEQLRIEAPVPGHSFVGIEAPNLHSTIVRLRPIMESEAFRKQRSPLTVALGRSVSGYPVIADLARMPHLLIAGTTGSGKSVCIQAITSCLVFNNTPDSLRMALLDPKMVELVRFNGLPHLFGKVETQLDRMLGVLRWALSEMDSRYRLLEKSAARDLVSYNRKAKRRGEKPLPHIVILIDELADLMMSAPDQTEHSLVRLAQMARATGIHMVVATQRPSTDVVTGLIKANFPARASFNVASSIDSRVILDVNGAEALLGHGDMLFLNPETGVPIRAQGALVTDEEIEKIISHWQTTWQPESAATQEAPWEKMLQTEDDSADKLVEQAIQIVRTTQRASASLLQRRLRIGYPRAARLMDELESLQVIGPGQGSGRDREVLLPPPDKSESQEIDDFID